MFCFDNIAKIIIGKTCPSLVASLNDPSNLPPEIAAMVPLKFTFAVVFDDSSFRAREKTLLIKSIVTTHGRSHQLPHSQQTTHLEFPSTPTKNPTLPGTLHSPSMAISKLSTTDSTIVR
jgi:hypothetical protein